MKHQVTSYKSLCLSLLALAAATPLAHAGKSPEPLPTLDSGLLLASGVGNAALSTARATTRDVGDRLFAMRAGILPVSETTQTTAGAADPKGGMASPITRTVSHLNCWEIYGSIYYYSEEQDAQYGVIPGVVGGPNGGLAQIHPNTDVDVFGGNVGIKHNFSENWSAGLALGFATTDVDTTFSGTSDTDTFAVTPYISYYNTDAFGSADYWADLMYSHGFNDMDIHRFTGAGLASASPEADTDQLEFTTGVNFGSGNVVHGPYGGLRWIDGSVDSYTEIGTGGGALFPEQDLESLASTLGYQASFPIRMTHGTLVPQIRGAWEHEFEDDANVLFGVPLGERDEDVAVLGAGLGFYCQSGWNAVLDYEARLSSNIEGHYVALKIGKEF
jgi:uncharacterized protein YhjY with autotransporter beta-barrel domain